MNCARIGSLSGLGPIDQGKKIGRNPQGHRRALQTIRKILEKAVGNEMTERVPKLLHVGHRMARLKSVSVKFSGAKRARRPGSRARSHHRANPGARGPAGPGSSGAARGGSTCCGIREGEIQGGCKIVHRASSVEGRRRMRDSDERPRLRRFSEDCASAGADRHGLPPKLT